MKRRISDLDVELAVLRIAAEAADAGKSMPSRADLGSMIDVHSSRVTDALRRLCAKGTIAVERGNGQNTPPVVILLATGARTAKRCSPMSAQGRAERGDDGARMPPQKECYREMEPMRGLAPDAYAR